MLQRRSTATRALTHFNDSCTGYSSRQQRPQSSKHEQPNTMRLYPESAHGVTEPPITGVWHGHLNMRVEQKHSYIQITDITHSIYTVHDWNKIDKHCSISHVCLGTGLAMYDDFTMEHAK